MININLDEIVKAARAGGEVVKKYFGEVLATEEKTNAGDLRTKADTESEEAILAVLRTSFPNWNIYAEESGSVQNDSEYTLVVDPLDGTGNFVLGIPDFAISIGVLKGDDAVAGVVYNPILDQMYIGQKGNGAFLNGKKIHVNSESDITRAVISCTNGYAVDRNYSERVEAVLRDLNVKRILNHWAPAYDYCLLASGRLEVVINKEGDLEDYVAAKVIVEEAGGKHSDFSGLPIDGKNNSFITTNGTSLHQAIVEMMSALG